MGLVGHHWPSSLTTEGQNGADRVWSRWTPVPEPSTALLLSLGLAALAVRREVITRLAPCLILFVSMPNWAEAAPVVLFGSEFWDPTGGPQGDGALVSGLQRYDTNGAFLSFLEAPLYDTRAAVGNEMWGISGRQVSRFNSAGNLLGTFTAQYDVEPGYIIFVVPEPGTALLLGLGLTALAVRREE